MKKNSIYAILHITAFMLILASPFIVSLFQGFEGNVLPSENRAVTSFPKETRLFKLLKHSAQIEDFAKDRVPARVSIIKCYDKLFQKEQKALPRPYLFYGKDDKWIFFKSQGRPQIDPVADYQGKNCFNEQQLVQVHSNLTHLKKILDRRNIALAIMIGPNKHAVYDQYLPLKIRLGKIGDDTKAHQLQKIGKQLGIPVIYPIEKLKHFPLLTYYPDATHWNSLGGYLAAQELMSVISPETKIPDLDLKELIAINYTTDAGYRYPNRDPSIQELIPRRCMNNGYFNLYSRDASKKIRVFPENKESRSPRKVLFIHDSFLTSMFPFLRTEFNRVFTLWNNAYLPSEAMLDKLKPDVVVYVYVERSLILLSSTLTKVVPSAFPYDDFHPRFAKIEEVPLYGK